MDNIYIEISVKLIESTKNVFFFYPVHDTICGKREDVYMEKDIINCYDFVKDIQLDDKVKSHLEYTTQEFETYLGNLTQYPEISVNLFLFDQALKENKNSSALERQLYSPNVVKTCESSFCTDPFLTQEKLFAIHASVLESEQGKYNLLPGQYRDRQVWIGNPGEDVSKSVHVPPKVELLSQYMADFIQFYNKEFEKSFFDPFLMGAIIHILFIKIHPFIDGNGRTARILHNQKFMELINKTYGTSFIYAPINISKNLDITREMYVERENAILFHLGYDNNKAWNNWFQYILTMVDEQIYFLNNRLSEYHNTMLYIAEQAQVGGRVRK